MRAMFLQSFCTRCRINGIRSNFDHVRFVIRRPCARNDLLEGNSWSGPLKGATGRERFVAIWGKARRGALIKEATSKGVRNIARYYHHETVQVDGENDDTIGNVRRGLMKVCGRTTFRQKSLNTPEVPVSETREKTVASRSQSRSQNRNNSRKRSSDSNQMGAPLIKRSCSSLRPLNSKISFNNRIHRRVITRDPGMPIYKTSSPGAIVKGFIGAISGKYAGIRINDISLTYLGHESLLNAGILHRDVSMGNILLTEEEDDGFLIDLDLAIKTSDDQASGAPSKTRTKIFMAIGALYGEPHSFMHDLESFFWVLFWICIHCDGLDEEGKVKRKVVPQYENWNYAGTEELADSKGGLVIEEERFNKATAGFTNTFQSLAACVRDLRQYVFPNGKRWLGENKELYSRMKTVFEREGRKLQKGWQHCEASLLIAYCTSCVHHQAIFNGLYTAVYWYPAIEVLSPAVQSKYTPPGFSEGPKLIVSGSQAEWADVGVIKSNWVGKCVLVMRLDGSQAVDW